MGWVQTVVRTACQLGIEEASLLAAAGVATDALQRERWPIDDMTRLWRTAARLTGDRSFGLKVGRQVGPASINVVGFVLQSAPTLRAAVTLVQKYQRLISDGGRFQLLPGMKASWLAYHPRQGELAFSPHQIEAVLATVTRLSTWLTGQPTPPQRVQFSQPRLGALAEYQKAFGCAVDFDQAFSGLLIDNALLDQPLPQADPQFARLHEQQLASRLATLTPGKTLPDSLTQWLTSQLAKGVPDRKQAAQLLGVSERTLARQLAAQGQTFRGLLDDVRREQALNAVTDHGRPLLEIAQSLGFAEPSTFYRAFRRWTGMPPVRWRKARNQR
jgi:AraC-like DNA-binding protein